MCVNVKVLPVREFTGLVPTKLETAMDQICTMGTSGLLEVVASWIMGLTRVVVRIK